MGALNVYDSAWADVVGFGTGVADLQKKLSLYYYLHIYCFHCVGCLHKNFHYTNILALSRGVGKPNLDGKGGPIFTAKLASAIGAYVAVVKPAG